MDCLNGLSGFLQTVKYQLLYIPPPHHYILIRLDVTHDMTYAKRTSRSTPSQTFVAMLPDLSLEDPAWVDGSASVPRLLGFGGAEERMLVHWQGDQGCGAHLWRVWSYDVNFV